jgi:RNA polymerase sigma-70 factor (ECF subfamily)
MRGRQSTPMKGSGTLEIASVARLADIEPATRQEARLDQARALDRFLAEVEKRAFRIAQMAVRDRDDALDIVQGAMLRLARSYGQRPSEEWKPLFYRILYNGIRDWQRRSSVRSRIFSVWPSGSRDDDDVPGDPYEHVADNLPDPSRRLMADEAMERLETAVAALPTRQREAFMLRCLEGMDVAQTATAMGCSEGSVKTHYFRALNALRAQLGEVWGP